MNNLVYIYDILDNNLTSVACFSPENCRIWWLPLALFFICWTQLSQSVLPRRQICFQFLYQKGSLVNLSKRSWRWLIAKLVCYLMGSRPISLRLIYRGSETISKLSIVTCFNHLSWSNTLRQRIQYFYQTVNLNLLFLLCFSNKN